MTANRSERRVTVLDYGAGNLHSLAKALSAPGVRVQIEARPARAADPRVSDLLVLPGVGAFAGASAHLAPARDDVRGAVEDGLPVIGICLGMQLLFEGSEEGPGAGIGVISGVVRRIRSARVPQIGWNTLEPCSPELQGLAMAYYANSYVCQPEDTSCVTAWSIYDDDCFAASVRGGPRGNVIGVQFHPEKSSTAGVRFLRALVDGACAESRP